MCRWISINPKLLDKFVRAHRMPEFHILRQAGNPHVNPSRQYSDIGNITIEMLAR